MKKSISQINTQYDKEDLAKKYSEKSQELKRKDPGRKFIYDHVSVFNKNGMLLDVGCGSGIDIAEYKKMGFKNIIGIDPSEKILAEAKILNQDISFLLGSFENIPLSDSSVDILVSRHSLHYSKDLKIALKEISRVLKPGGVLIAIISNPEFDSLLKLDQDGNITTTLFEGKISITFPKHNTREYFSTEFYSLFDLIEKFEYNGPERDDYISNKNNTLGFVAKRKKQ